MRPNWFVDVRLILGRNRGSEMFQPEYALTLGAPLRSLQRYEANDRAPKHVVERAQELLAEVGCDSHGRLAVAKAVGA